MRRITKRILTVSTPRILAALAFSCISAHAHASNSSHPQLVDFSLQSGPYKISEAVLGGGSYVVEVHLVKNGDGYDLFHQCEINKVCLIKDAQISTSPQKSSAPIMKESCRFPYFFTYENIFYLTCGKSEGSDDMYLYSSKDQKNWLPANGGEPIVKQSPGTNWGHIWNVAILPVGNRWHMLAETSISLDRMDIAYSYVDFGEKMDFTPNQSGVVIKNGGNPELIMKEGKMIALHGLYHDRGPEDAWYITMSTASPERPLEWTTRRDKLLIEQKGIHIADPTYIELNGKGILGISYNQNRVLMLEGPPIEP